MPLKRLAPVLLFSLLAQPAYAWNRVGHQAIADIAEHQLDAVARQKVADLLAQEGYRTLSDIAHWADLQKQEHPGEGVSHSVRLPLDGASFTADACPSGFCVTTAIDHYEQVLADPNASKGAQLEALKYLVHLVGDVHQPLHATARTGGAQVVILDGRTSTLHKVWDSAFAASHMSGSQVAEQAERDAGPQQGGGTPSDWAIESRDVARTSIFSMFPRLNPRATALPADYTRTNWSVAATRLVQAGTRLAQVLNRVLDPQPSADASSSAPKSPAQQAAADGVKDPCAVPGGVLNLRALVELALFSPGNLQGPGTAPGCSG